MITRPFPFNAYYGEDEIREVDGDAWRLEVTGLVRTSDAGRCPSWRAAADGPGHAAHLRRGLERHRQVGRRAVRALPAACRRRPEREIRRLQVRRRLLHQHRHGHRAASANAAGAELRRPGVAAEIRLPDEAAHAHQARLQESRSTSRPCSSPTPIPAATGKTRATTGSAAARKACASAEPDSSSTVVALLFCSSTFHPTRKTP